MKFGQLIEYNKRNIFLKNHVENEAGRLEDLVLVLKKLYMRYKQKVYWLVSNVLR